MPLLTGLLTIFAKPIDGFSKKLTGVGILLLPAPSFSGSTSLPLFDTSDTGVPNGPLAEVVAVLLYGPRLVPGVTFI